MRTSKRNKNKSSWFSAVGEIPENTRRERADLFLEVIAKNTYTGEIVYMNSENDADSLGCEDEIKFYVRNVLTGRVVVFYNVEEAFEYKETVNI